MKVMFCVLAAVLQMSVAQMNFRNEGLPQDTLATIGTRVLTGRDFLERFELMPWPQKENKARHEITKREFLYSLVAEKLLAQEATAQQIGNDSVSAGIQYNLERIFVRDELYKQEVIPNVKISNEEIRTGVGRFAYELELEVLGIISKAEGDLFYKKFKQSKNKRSVFRQFRDSLYLPIDTIQLSYGSADIALENAAYEIDKDSLSKPVESKVYGWVMARLLKKYSNPQFARLSGSDQIHKVRTIITQRKEDTLATKTFSAVTSPHRAEAKWELFYPFADTVRKYLTADSLEYRTKNVYHLPVALLDVIERSFAARKNEVFVTFDSGDPLTLGQILLGLRNNYIVFPNLQKEYIEWVLNNNIKTVIQNELLTREGFKKNLQQSENVRRDLSTWMDNRKGLLLLHRVADSVSVDSTEIEAEYLKDPGLYGATVMVKLREILVDSITLARQLRERINRGEDFAILARQYSKRKEWAARGGESDFMDVKKMGDLGLYAATAPLGEVEGPWRIKDGLTIFSVIERKILDDSLRANFGETRQRIEQKLLRVKKQETIDRYVGTLAKKYGVTIDEGALTRIPTTQHSMFTWRHIGFGGRIVAVPQVQKMSEWIYEWRRQEQLNQ
ncbi:MAG: peptidylprolyl isomerase [Bacteroidota bacterium]